MALFTLQLRLFLRRKLRFQVVVSLVGLLLPVSAAVAESSVIDQPIFIPENLYSADFVEDRGGVTVIKFTGDYDRDLADGSFNAAARAVVASEYYQHNADNVDFLVIFSDFEFDTGGAQAFHIGISNGISGIGLPIFSYASDFGSAGELKGYIDMGALNRYQSNSLVVKPSTESIGFETNLKVLAHETLHQWAVHTEIDDLRSDDGGHWSFFLDSEGSVQYGHDWVDNQDGTFTAKTARVGFSQLDLYLMGLIDKSEVPDWYVINPSDAEYAKSDLPKQGITIAGTRTEFSIEDFISVHGEREPSAAESSKVFRYGFIYLTSNDQPAPSNHIAKINEIRSAYATRMSVLTGGKAIARVKPAVGSVDSPGTYEVIDSGSAISTAGVNITLGIEWLRDQQLVDGHWQDKPETGVRDTHAVLDALDSLGLDAPDVSSLRNWIAHKVANNNDTLSRLSTLADFDPALKSQLSQQLLAQKISSQGWGLESDFKSSVLDTALAICALHSLSGAQDQVLQGISHINASQNADGGWGYVAGGKSSVWLTAQVLRALHCANHPVAGATNALNWLQSKVHADGGFGDLESTVHETAMVLLTLFDYESTSLIDFQLAVAFLAERQGVDGDWQGSVYKTALALQSIQASSLPNLLVESLSADLSEVRDGDFVEITAVVKNDSADIAPTSEIQFLQDPPVNGTGEFASVTVPELPPFSAVSVSADWLSLDANSAQKIVAIADPGDAILERSEQDNQAGLVISVLPPDSGVDLVVNDSEFLVSPAILTKLPSQLSLLAVLRNIGIVDAEGVLVQLWQGEPDNGGQLLTSDIVTVSARSSSTLNFDISHERQGTTQYVLIVDPNDEFSETNESNNRAIASVATQPGVDLDVTPADISPNTAQVYLNQTVNFSVNIRNQGTQTTPNTQVDFLIENAAGQSLIQSQHVILEPAEEVSITSSWLADFDGVSTFRVRIDGDNLVAEVDETNNEATTTVEASLLQGANLALSFTDLGFSPEPGYEGYGATLTAQLRNTGTDNVVSTKVSFYDGNPVEGGALIGSQAVIDLVSAQSRTVQVSWPSIPDDATRFIYAVADPDNQLVELDETDNIAFSQYQVQSLPDLAVTRNSIQSTPPFPKESEVVQFSISVTNRGKQSAENVAVRAFYGESADGVLISDTLMSIPGSGDATWDFEYTFAEQGSHAIYIDVDAENALLESDESNNTAARNYLIQDGDFYVSDKFLSPNGDGTKDVVNYVFNLPEEALVSVVVSDKYQQVVAELEVGEDPVQSGEVSWDGHNIFGSLVGDGLYTFSVRQADGAVLGERTVTLDTNRSPLSEALGTPYSLERNLTCRIGQVYSVADTNERQIPDTQDLVYGPNDQYIYFLTYFESYTDDEGTLVETDEAVLFPSGLYRALNDGTEVKQLFADDEIPVQDILSYRVSPDGSKLVVLTRTDQSYRLWVVPTDGSSITELTSPDDMVLAAEESPRFYSADYISDHEILLLDAGEQSNQPFRLWKLVDAEGATPQLIFDKQDIGLTYFAQPIELNSTKSHALVRLSNEGSYYRFESVSYDLMTHPELYQLVLVDLTQTGAATDLGFVSEHQWSPDGNTFVVGDTLNHRLEILDLSGQSVQTIPIPAAQTQQFTSAELELLKAFFGTTQPGATFGEGLSGRISNITWNLDASEFAFVIEDYLAAVIESNGCFYRVRGEEKTEVGAIESRPIFDHLLELVVGSANAQSGNDSECVGVPPSIQRLFDNYQTVDGVYVAKVATSEVKLQAKTSTLNASFYDSGSFNMTGRSHLDGLLGLDLTSPNGIGVNLNRFGVPITPDGYPYVSWTGPSWAFDNLPDARPSRRTLTWLDGARELLVSNGDDLQYYDRMPYFDEGVAQKASVSTVATKLGTTLPGEVVPSQFRPFNNSLIVNLDQPAEDSTVLFSSRDFAVAGSHWNKRGVYPSHTGKFLTYLTDDAEDMCFASGLTTGYRQFQSLMNLTADLRARKSVSLGGFLLEGTATDKHFSHYQLEYADVASPDLWHAIAPASNIEVLDDRFTTWVPPYVGNFYVRLSVYDLAGNARHEISQVSNQETPSITGVYLSETYFSPNGDGTKDVTELHFTVREPVNLQVRVEDAEGVAVRTITESFDLIGADESISWNGRNDSGQVVADGIYRIVVQRYEYFATLDNTPPQLVDETGPLFKPESFHNDVRCEYEASRDISNAQDLALCKVAQDLFAEGVVTELNLDVFSLQSRELESATWQDISVPDDLRSIPESNNLVLKRLSTRDKWSGSEFRLIARDLAGNISTLLVDDLKRNKAHILGFDFPVQGLEQDDEPQETGVVELGNLDIKNGFGYASHDGFGLAPDYRFALQTQEKAIELELVHTASAPIQFVELLYRDAELDAPFTSIPIGILAQDANTLRLLYQRDDLVDVLSNRIELKVRLRLQDQNVIDSDAIVLTSEPVFYQMPEFGCQPACKHSNTLVPQTKVDFGTLIPVNQLDRFVLRLTSVGDKTDQRFIGAGQVIVDEQNPTTLSGRFAGERILRLDAPALNLIAECGYRYQLEAELYYQGQTEPLIASVSDSTDCVSFDIDVDPVIAQTCDAPPVDQVDIHTRVGADTPTDAPLYIQVGLPSQQNDAEPLSMVLYSENLPQYGQVYSFRLDTLDYPEGALKLRAVLALASGEVQQRDFSVPIVHTPPVVQITSPLAGQKLCAVSYLPPPGREETITGVELQGQVSSAGPDLALTLSGPANQSVTVKGGTRVGYLGESGLLDAEGSNLVGPTLQGVTDPAEIGNRTRVSDNAVVRAAKINAHPVTVQTAVSGLLGIPEVTGSGMLELELQSFNWSGARMCASVVAQVDAEVDGLIIEQTGTLKLAYPQNTGLQFPYFSPNNDGLLDLVEFDLQVDEDVTLDMTVLATEYVEVSLSEKIIQDRDQVASPYNAQMVNAGQTVLDWNGTDDAGNTLADGLYRVVIQLQDSCGNTAKFEYLIGIDNTAPNALISYPVDGDNIAILIRVLGRVFDDHFARYQLSLSHDDETFNLLASGTSNVEGVLGEWDSFGETGVKTLRLDVADKLGNEASTYLAFTLPERQDLITALETQDYFVSPNSDGRLDQLVVRLGVSQSVIGDIHILNNSGQSVRQLAHDNAYEAGYHTVVWDGYDALGVAVPDGSYKVSLTVEGNGQIQTETIDFEVDTTVPAVTLSALRNGYLELAGQPSILGSITDKNSIGYQISIKSPADAQGDDLILTPLVIGSHDAAQQGTLAELPENLSEVEQEYDLTVVASDAAGNRTTVNVKLAVDSVPPQIRLDSPATSSVHRLQAAPLNIEGLVHDKFLKSYTIEVIGVPSLASAQILASGNQNTDGVLGSWDLSGFEDGRYVLTLTAQDLSGNSSTTQVEVDVDNTVPELSIFQPAANGYLTELLPVLGTANDDHFQQYTLAMAAVGTSQAAVNLITSNLAVSTDVLFNWTQLPEDGRYEFVLSGVDLAGNSAETRHLFTVDTQPPAAPVLRSVNKGTDPLDVSIEWETNTESDLAGYILYRNGVRVNTSLFTATHYLDPDLPEGQYTYTLSAVDTAGLESEPSAGLSIRVDVSPPDVVIAAPSQNARVSQLVDINGTAYSVDDFKQYRVLIRAAGSADITLIESPASVRSGLLVQWDTLGLPQGDYLVRLEAEDTSGNISHVETAVTVDNEPPSEPLNLTAVIQGGSDGLLSWAPPAGATDVYGYLLYRNGRLANTQETVIGDLRPYAMTATQYLDEALRDGDFEYVVYALDLAGNMSPPSNTASLSIDQRAPSAVITSVEDGAAFDESLYILAETEDIDIANVDLQFRPVGSAAWSSMHLATSLPYEFLWDTTALPLGDYELRAVASDLGGKTDPMPSIVSVTKRDILAPSQTQGLAVLVNGSDGELTWLANEEADLDGYNVYRRDCDSCSLNLLNSSLVTELNFTDTVAENDEYLYQVSAVDTTGNEGQPSASVTAVFDSTVAKPSPIFSLDGTSLLELHLGNAGYDFDLATVEIQAPSSQLSDAELSVEGLVNRLEVPVTMTELGLHDMTSVIESTQRGFAARPNSALVVNVGKPSAPTGLIAQYDAVDDEIDLQWNPNPAGEVVQSYLVERDAQQLGANQLIDDATAFANSGTTTMNNYLPQNNFNWYWRAGNGSDVRFGQTWAQPKLVTKVEFSWTSYFYAATELDVFAQIDGRWVPVATWVQSSSSNSAIVTLPHPVPTTSIEVRVKSWYYRFAGGELRQMRVFADDLYDTASFVSDQPDEGMHEYRVRAVNNYGGISEYSEATQIGFGDVTPPDAVTLSGDVQGSLVSLNWSASADAVTYNVYQEGALRDSVSVLNYAIPNMPNDVYSFYVTAVDVVGNESLNSNVVTLEVNLAPPMSPLALQANVNQTEQNIELMWQSLDDSVPVSYRVYRSEQLDGSFEPIGETDQLLFLNYVDDLEFGVDYYYYVTALDAAGNESAPSNTANAKLVAQSVVTRPVLTAPTDFTQTYETSSSQVDVAGIAQPGSLVYLLHQGEFLADPVQASYGPSYEDYQYGGDGEFIQIEFSDPDVPLGLWRSEADGSVQFFTYRNNAWQPFDSSGILSNVRLTRLTRMGDNRVLLSADDGLAYVANLETLTLTSVAINNTPSFYVSELLSLHADTNSAIVEAFVVGQGDGLYHLKLDTNELQVLPQAYRYRISPDGRYYAYTVSPAATPLEVSVLDIVTNTQKTFQIPDSDGDLVFENVQLWSPDNSQLVLTANTADGRTKQTIVDHVNETMIELLETDLSIGQSVWSGNRTLFYQAYDPIYGDSLLKSIALTSGETTQWDDGELLWEEDRLLAVDTRRRVFIQDEYGYLFSTGIAGQFLFPDVRLEEGVNVFTALSVDAEMEISELADAITVNYQTVPLPDYKIGITLNPPLAIVGQETNVRLIVSNIGNALANTAQVRLRILDNGGDLTLLTEQTVGPVAANSSLTIDVPWRPEISGNVSLIAEIDASFAVNEGDESNNARIQEVSVLESNAPSVDVHIDPSSAATAVFNINEILTGNAVLRNPGEELSGELILDVVDASDVLVAHIKSVGINALAYGAELQVEYDWNTGAVLPGAYRVRAQLVKDGAVLTRSDAEFSVFEPVNLLLGLRTNQYRYSPGEAMRLTASIANLSVNALFESGSLDLEIRDSNGMLVHSAQATVGELLATDRADAVFNWSVGQLAAGLYTAKVTLSNSQTSITHASAQFEIRSSASVEFDGAVEVIDPQVVPNQAIEFSATLRNLGSIDLTDLVLDYRLQSGVSPIRTLTDTVTSLPVSQLDVSALSFDGTGLLPGRYQLLMVAVRLNGVALPQERVLGSTNIDIIENTPPLIQITQPNAGAVVNSRKVHAQFAATDDSGVAGVEVRFDGDWFAANESGFDRTQYYSPMSDLTDGEYKLSARATDVLGNTSDPVSQVLIIDNTPPNIEFSNINEGQQFGGSVQPELGITDEHLDSWNASVNGQPWELGSAVTEPGDYRMIVNAFDKAGNTRRVARTFSVVSDAPPVVTANDDLLSLKRGVWGTIDLLTNDRFPSRSLLDVSILESPTYGTLVMTGKGQFNYYPNLTFLGIDTFTYQIKDRESGLKSTAVVTVDVGPSVSCSLVPDHRTESATAVFLPAWAITSGQASNAPKYQITILGTSNDDAFVDGKTPLVTYPACDLVYTPKPGTNARVRVQYQVRDVATGGQRYTSAVREFELFIANKPFSKAAIIPSLKLLLMDQENETE